MSRTRRNDARRGQTLVIFALGLLAFLGMVGLVIDGGNAFAQQRKTQNGADAAAEAGTTELARRALGVPPAGNDATWDARVNQAIADSATYNGLTIFGTPQYTDFDGVALGPVGTGSIPANTSGVAVNGDRNFRTYVAGVLGMTNFTASASATARTGFVKGVAANVLLPVAFPVILEQCETGGGSNRIVTPLYGSPPGSHEWPYGPNNRLALPLCSNGPGNIGWIDWTPTAGGASEVAASITTPNGPAINLPKWHYITQTGAITSLDAAMDLWEGRDIYLPIFEAVPDDLATPADESLLGTCGVTPTGTQTQLSDCPAGQNGGNGSNQWYYLVTFANFHLERSFIQGNNEAECNASDLVSTATYNGLDPTTRQLLNTCLVGYFNDAVAVGGEVTLNAPSTSFEMRGVQLIK